MLDYAVAPHEGKGTGEQALLRQLLSRIYEGDIILGNAHFENYLLLVPLQLAEADIDTRGADGQGHQSEEAGYANNAC